jgi:hypothetical protein
MIEHLQGFPANVLGFACHGAVKKQDYDSVLMPAVRDALKSHDKLRLYYEVAADFATIEPGAVWEDFKIGMESLTRWERIAVVTDVEWIKRTVQFFGFMMPASELKIFPLAEAAQARAWITAGA